MTRITIPIDAALAGLRLDKALAERSDLSRSYLQHLIACGNVFLAGKAISNAAAKVREGQIYQIMLPEIVPLALEPVPMPLAIIYEDAQLLVINKPAGLTVHPAAGTQQPTLVHGLLAHCAGSLSGIGGVARPGIVHRLDKDTSGLMLVAKTDAAHLHLSAQLKDRSLSRRYEALCWGCPNPPSGTIDAPIGRHPKDRLRMAVVKQGGRAARTHYTLLASYGVISHIACELDTGRTHQIRVHLNHIGHGLLGDPVYGDNTHNRLKRLGIDNPSETMRVITDYRRQALHAANITFIHPQHHEVMHFECPLPKDMICLLEYLKDLQ